MLLYVTIFGILLLLYFLAGKEDFLKLMLDCVIIWVVCIVFWLVAWVLIGGSKQLFGTNLYGGLLFIALCITYGVIYSSRGEKHDK